MDVTYNLPRGYLSYSALALWRSDKERFRKKYYLNEDNFETAETIFGKKIAKQLENKEKIPDVVHYEKAEKKIQVTLPEGFDIMGYLDGFTEDDLKIVEIKSGHVDRNGKVPWDRLKVRKHKQLPYYCLLVKLKYGTYNPNVTLQWLETDFIEDTREFNGHILTAKTRKLKLTGRIETFERHIAEWELDHIKEEIILTAKEISEDYTLWQKNQTKKQ